MEQPRTERREIVPRATLQYKLKKLMFDFSDPIEPLECKMKISECELLLSEFMFSQAFFFFPAVVVVVDDIRQ